MRMLAAVLSILHSEHKYLHRIAPVGMSSTQLTIGSDDDPHRGQATMARSSVILKSCPVLFTRLILVGAVSHMDAGPSAVDRTRPMPLWNYTHISRGGVSAIGRFAPSVRIVLDVICLLSCWTCVYFELFFNAISPHVRCGASRGLEQTGLGLRIHPSSKCLGIIPWSYLAGKRCWRDRTIIPGNWYVCWWNFYLLLLFEMGWCKQHEN